MESLYSSISTYYSPKDYNVGINATDTGELASDLCLLGNRVLKKDIHTQQDFLGEFRSLFWFSYRKDFPPILPSYYTSDMGWGCMLRSGQMMLSQAFIRHILGPNWHAKSIEEYQQANIQIIQMFEDIQSAPFSIHKIALQGVKFGKSIGEWFAPSTVSQVFSDLVKQSQPHNLSIYVSNDQMLYLDEIRNLCETENTFEWKSIIIIIPLRLGLDTVNEVYHNSLKSTFHFPQSLGIIGGKPRAAMYFVAYQDNYLYCLDPHVVQPFIAIGETNSVKGVIESYHCNNPNRMPMSGIDPSLALGFYCSDKKDFDDFWSRAEEISDCSSPLFMIAEEAPDYRHNNSNHKGLTLEEFEEDVVIL